MNEVTRILDELDGGDEQATNRLLALVYDELRKLAADRMANEPAGHTLQATALVHEAYLRLVGSEKRDWKSRRYFFAACAEAMRRILVERARSRARLKRGGDRRRVELDPDEIGGLAELPGSTDLLALDEAIEKLTAEDAPKAELVKLRYFTGLTAAEAAQALDISKATCDRWWAYARAFLYHEVKKGDTGDAAPPPGT